MHDILSIISERQPKVGKTLLIAIDGHGGSGKSTLAKILSKELSAELIHTDDFASWDNPLDWWPLVIEKVFEPIASGSSTLNYSRSSWAVDHHPEPVTDQPVTKIMILEGVSALRKEFREHISLGIFVDTPRDICLQRGLERDKQTGKTKEEVTRMWNDWFDEEDKYLERDNPKGYADIVVSGTKSFENQLNLDHGK